MVLYRRPPSQKSFGGRQPPIGLGFAMDLVRLIGKRDFVRHCGTRIDPANHACMLQPFLERGSRGMGFIARVIVVAFVTVVGDPRVGDMPTDPLGQAQAALAQGKAQAALELAGKAIADNAGNVPALLFRGGLLGSLGRHEEAAADFTKIIVVDPKNADAYNRRGAEQFKLGRIAESIGDFDKYLLLKPGDTAGHWMRGIAYYYAGRYEEGRRQFAVYEQVDTNDVENAVWHYLCNAHLIGTEKARAALLKIGRDRRAPMMEVYALFGGKARPADVLAAAGAAEVAQRAQASFLAHLYLGLYYESAGDEPKMLKHMKQAADARMGGYMGDVARVHLMVRRTKRPQKS
jgi:lipoprotein NlpI